MPSCDPRLMFQPSKVFSLYYCQLMGLYISQSLSAKNTYNHPLSSFTFIHPIVRVVIGWLWGLLFDGGESKFKVDYSCCIIIIMSQIDLKIRALRIYLEEMQQLHQQLRMQNEQTTAFLIEQGHNNIRQQLQLFQIKYISQKIGELLP